MFGSAPSSLIRLRAGGPHSSERSERNTRKYILLVVYQTHHVSYYLVVSKIIRCKFLIFSKQSQFSSFYNSQQLNTVQQLYTRYKCNKKG